MSNFTSNDNMAPSIEKGTPSGLDNAKNAVVNSKFQASRNPTAQLTSSLDASAAANAVKNHPITQSVTNGPVAENVKDQHAKTQAEFSDLAASRRTPSTPAATGQNLTHYHSFFSNLLSWKNPRASGIAYASVVLFIFAARYLDIIRYSFKLTYMVLGITVMAEAVGKALFSTGFTSQIRPRKYYTVSRETLNALTGDIAELINFFVIEAQRIVFAENVVASAAAFVSAFLSYFLIKFVPFWGLSLIATSVLFLGPLIYKSNQELIDHHLSNATQVISQQSEQVRALASQHAAHATEATKSLVGDYSAKAQEIIGNARGRSVSPVASAKPVKTEPLVKKENIPSASYKAEDFPPAPKEEFKAPIVADTHEPLIST